MRLNLQWWKINVDDTGDSSWSKDTFPVQKVPKSHVGVSLMCQDLWQHDTHENANKELWVPGSKQKYSYVPLVPIVIKNVTGTNANRNFALCACKEILHESIDVTCQQSPP